MPHLMSFRRKWMAGYCHKADLAARPEAVASVFHGPVEYILRVVRPLVLRVFGFLCKLLSTVRWCF